MLELLFATLNAVCRNAGFGARPQLPAFDVEITDAGEVWCFRPDPAGPWFVRGAHATPTFRLATTQEGWRAFVLHSNADGVHHAGGSVDALKTFADAFQAAQSALSVRFQKPAPKEEPGAKR